MALLQEDYSLSDLVAHIKKKLGGSVWRLEGMSDAENDLIEQSISESVLGYSRRCPLQGWEIIETTSATSAYTIKTKPCYGPWRVDFIEPIPLVAPLTYNLVGVTPLSNFSGENVAGFLNWRKVFRRVISSTPAWEWDQANRVIYIYNISGISRACVYLHLPVSFDQIPLHHKDFIRRNSISHAKLALGNIRRKFGDLPGPGGNTVKLDGDSLVKEAEAELEKQVAELMAFQPRALPFFD